MQTDWQPDTRAAVQAFGQHQICVQQQNSQMHADANGCAGKQISRQICRYAARSPDGLPECQIVRLPDGYSDRSMHRQICRYAARLSDQLNSEQAALQNKWMSSQIDAHQQIQLTRLGSWLARPAKSRMRLAREILGIDECSKISSRWAAKCLQRTCKSACETCERLSLHSLVCFGEQLKISVDIKQMACKTPGKRWKRSFDLFGFGVLRGRAHSGAGWDVMGWIRPPYAYTLRCPMWMVDRWEWSLDGDGRSLWMVACCGWLLVVDGCLLWMAACCGWLLVVAANAEANAENGVMWCDEMWYQRHHWGKRRLAMTEYGMLRAK
jgi:hypothetical protein